MNDSNGVNNSNDVHDSNGVHDDLLTTKIALGFDQLDADGDGRLTERDHVLMGESSARALGHSPGSEAERRIIDAYVGIWRDLHQPTVGGADAISRDEFIASTLTLADDQEAAAATVGRLAEIFLSVADANGDGTVDPDEFQAFHHAHFPHLGRARADTAFRHLDRNGDGTLSHDEFVGAIVEYWTSRDPEAPGNWWTGEYPSRAG
ncbi:EF-hand domain-containing protein [Streptomyces sp. CBMA156]|uniref:EF-hand domain-containing protein n=1 Tax=Streptomyces sp. CBMA156 TaxID=1930280 RepID=UPI001CB81585|nr:EF-hand domain-containing protein [Streptomyces sp. CBMA156]